MKRLIAVAITATLLPAAAAAGSHDDESTGIRLGSFVARPSVTITQGYNSNIFLTSTNETDSFITVAALRGQIESDWNRNGLRLDTGLEYGYFIDSTDDNYLDGFANLTGVLDVKRNISVTATAGYSREHDARGSDDVVGAQAEPVEFDDISLSLQGNVGFGRFRVDPFVQANYLNYDDVDALGGGPQINNDDRDRLRTVAGVELGYAVRRGYEAFIRSSYQWTEYDDSVDDAGVDRDSTGFRVLGGVKVDLTRLITASAGVGLLSRNFDDPTLNDFTGLSTDAELQWSITRRTTLFAAASRDAKPTTVAGSSTFIDSQGSVGVTHELLRTLSVSGSASYTDRDFRGISRNDQLFTGRLGAEWMINPRFAITPEYRYSNRDSNSVGNYDVHEVRVSGTLRF